MAFALGWMKLSLKGFDFVAFTKALQTMAGLSEFFQRSIFPINPVTSCRWAGNVQPSCTGSEGYLDPFTFRITVMLHHLKPISGQG